MTRWGDNRTRINTKQPMA